MSASPPPPRAEATPGPAARPAAARLWRRFKILALGLGLIAAALLALYVLAALSFSYSTGDRAGYVQKFSRKGWVCKTWEGELAMVSLPGALSEVFRFTARDEAVAAEINRHLGERVALTYAQHLGLPSCFGETSYYVVRVRRVQP